MKSNKPLVFGVRFFCSQERKSEAWIFLQDILGFKQVKNEPGGELGVYIYSASSFHLILDSNVQGISPEVELSCLYISVLDLDLLIEQTQHFAEFWGLKVELSNKGDYVCVSIPEVYYFSFMFSKRNRYPGETDLATLATIINKPASTR